MLCFTRSALAAFLAVSAMVVAVAGPAQARAHKTVPHVLELYTAQGCTGCPEADQALGALVGRKTLIALTLPVDYWDYLGWKDTFAKPEFTQRQAAYKTHFRLRETYSPQLVVDGRQEFAGVDAQKIESATHSPPAYTARVRLAARSARVDGAAPTGGADVWLVRYDPQELSVQVKTGDNKGRTISQRNVVKELVKLGRWRGGARSFDLPASPDPALKAVVIVQAPRGGPILGVGQS